MNRLSPEKLYGLIPTPRKAAAVLAAALALAGCGNKGADVEASSRSASPGLPALEARMGDITQYPYPVSTDWDHCPEGDRTLHEDLNVNAEIFGQDIFAGYVEIGKITLPAPELGGLVGVNESEPDNWEPIQVYDGPDGVVAFCGQSIGQVIDDLVLGPSEGTTVVIPNRDGVIVYSREFYESEVARPQP